MCSLHKNPSRIAVSKEFPTNSSVSCTQRHYLATSLVLCAQEFIQTCRFNTVSCDFVRFMYPVPLSGHELSFVPPAQELRISSISCTWGHDRVSGLVLCPQHKKTLLKGNFNTVSYDFRPYRARRVMIWPRLSFVPPSKGTPPEFVRPFCVIPAHEPLRSTRFQYSFERLSSSSCTQGQCAQA